MLLQQINAIKWLKSKIKHVRLTKAVVASFRKSSTRKQNQVEIREGERTEEHES